jgi:hypothetical protein
VAARWQAWARHLVPHREGTMSSTKPALQHTPIDIKIKLAALWAATVLCYIYCDYFELYVPGKLTGMLAGKMGPLGPVTQSVLLGTSVMLAVQCVMVYLALALKPAISKWLNIVLGLVFALMMLVVIQGAWTFYQFFGIIETALLLTIVWQAWTWPRVTPS